MEKTIKVYIAADGRGEKIKQDILQNYDAGPGLPKVEFVDLTPENAPDFNDSAIAVAQAVSRDNLNAKANLARGILICNSGQGMAMQANRFKGVRAAVCPTMDHAREVRQHLDANVLCIPAQFNDPDTVAATIDSFLFTDLREESDGRRGRRIAKLDQYGANLD